MECVESKIDSDAKCKMLMYPKGAKVILGNMIRIQSLIYIREIILDNILKTIIAL